MIFQIILSFLACVLYIIETYATDVSYFMVPELLLSILFGIDYFLFFYCAVDKLLPSY